MNARTATEVERRCIVTGDIRHKGDLIRFIVGPEDRIVPDIEGKLPGRGLWVGADRSCLETAVMKGLFSRAAKKAVQVDDEIVGIVEGLLRKRCLNLVGLGRKSGAVLTGFEKVKASLEAGNAALLIEAVDGAPDGKRKLAALGRGVSTVENFSCRELSLALGRENVIHAAVTNGRLAETLQKEVHRLLSFQGADATAVVA